MSLARSHVRLVAAGAALMLIAAALVVSAPAPLAAFASRVQQGQQQPPPPAPPPANVAGKWDMFMDIENMGPAQTALDLKQDGGKLSGTYTGSYGTFQIEGTVKGRLVEFGFTMSAQGTDVWLGFKGEVAEDNASMKGTGSIEGLGAVSWTATRKK